MKVRIKFTKEGPMKFVGHLDTMRYFQKAIRRAGLPIAFSGGYSPHMIMSFAAPLGVGITSLGEYFDMELTTVLPTDEIARRLDEEMVEGVRVLSAVQVEDGKASKAMSLVAAADYLVTFREGRAPKGVLEELVAGFLSQKEILVTKETKKGEKQVDIRPCIYEMRAYPEGGIFLCLASASANYTKPEAVMESFFAWMGEEAPPFAWMVERREVYGDLGKEGEHSFVSLEALGKRVE
ncbi:MAG: TIGR03936 family radical SAM-associated protein [Eubacteriales bacterium]|nr:TIGR03936 family radical SAM-associated protein [Eubacteriales bacterium]